MTAWVRHGQSTWNASGRLQGLTAHPPLTALGRRQATRTAELLAASGGIRRVLASPAIRAQQTAEILGAVLGLPVQVASCVAEQGLDEPEARVLDRLATFVATQDLEVSAVVSHGDTIRLAVKLLTGSVCPVPDNGAVVYLPGRPARFASGAARPVEDRRR